MMRILQKKNMKIIKNVFIDYTLSNCRTPA